MIVDDDDRLHPGVDDDESHEVTRTCVSADKLSDGAFGLLPSYRQ